MMLTNPDSLNHIVAALTEYTGEEPNVNNLEVIKDPLVADTWALRVKFPGQPEYGDKVITQTYMIVSWPGKGAIDPWKQLLEVEFKSWPPKSVKHNTNFFV